MLALGILTEPREPASTSTIWNRSNAVKSVAVVGCEIFLDMVLFFYYNYLSIDKIPLSLACTLTLDLADALNVFIFNRLEDDIGTVWITPGS